MVWQDKNGVWRNQGGVDIYCRRTVTGNYQPKYTTQGVLDLFKEGPEQVSKFKALREHAIEVIKASEDPTAFIVWKDTRAELEHLMEDSTVWEAPKDQYWPVDVYVRTKGMPETNGLGHRRGKDLNGKDCVIVPESCYMTKVAR